MKWVLMFLIAAILIVSCQTRQISNNIPLERSEPAHRIILVTIDGVRWQDVFSGPNAIDPVHNIVSEKLLPNIYKNFVRNGIVFGKTSEVRLGNLAHVSLPGYYEILSGKVTNCLDNSCATNQEKTIADEFRTSAVFGSWNLISQVTKANTIDTGNFTGYRPDADTIQVAENYMGNNKPEFLWVSLGDADEWGHAGSYESYQKSLVLADNFIGSLVSRYSKEATIIVTTDHGRGKDWRHHGGEEESGRVFIMMTGLGIRNLGFVTNDRIIYSYEIKNIIMNLVHRDPYSSLLDVTGLTALPG